MRSFILAFATFAAGAAAFADDPVKQRLDRAVDFLEARIKSDPEDFIALNRLCDALLRRSRWTGQLDDWRRASKLAERSLTAVPEDLNPGGLAVSAQVAMGGHQFAQASAFAKRLAAVTSGKTLPVQILGDASLEMGNLDEAAKAFEQLEELAGAEIGVESRSARLAWMRGKIDESAEHLANALTLAREQKDPETLVWALVQSGEHAFRRGKFDVAEKHYAEALKNVPGYWAALDHMAELQGAQGKDDEAIALFTKAAEASGRPEIWQALGDFHLFKRRNDEAKSAHDRALAGYQGSIELGETLYVHHLAGFYSDSRENAEEAIKWARRDLEARKSGYAWDSLAWALSKSGDTAGALDAARRAIATGLADPHVLQHAGMIFLSAGEVPEGQRLLKRCAEVNPHFTGFHVHR